MVNALCWLLIGGAFGLGTAYLRQWRSVLHWGMYLVGGGLGSVLGGVVSILFDTAPLTSISGRSIIAAPSSAAMMLLLMNALVRLLLRD